MGRDAAFGQQMLHFLEMLAVGLYAGMLADDEKAHVRLNCNYARGGANQRRVIFRGSYARHHPYDLRIPWNAELRAHALCRLLTSLLHINAVIDDYAPAGSKPVAEDLSGIFRDED